MKLKNKKDLTLGDLVESAYRFWGAEDAQEMLQLAFNRRMVVRRPQNHLAEGHR